MGAALDVVKEFFETFAEGDVDGTDAFFDDACAFVMPLGPMTKAEHKMMGLGFKAALPDSHMEIDHVVDNGDEVFLEGRFVGTHTGDLPAPDGSTLPASGNKLELRSSHGTVVAMSQTALDSLSAQQRATIERLGGPIVAAAIPTIETLGGGSVRCMLAEIHLPKK